MVAQICQNEPMTKSNQPAPESVPGAAAQPVPAAPQSASQPSPTWERMVAGKMYIADDPYLAKVRREGLTVQHELNATNPSDNETIRTIAARFFGSFDPSATVVPPVHCDYGANVHIGPEVFINSGAILLDVAPITLGRRVLIGPRVTITTAGHPVPPRVRAETDLEFGTAITIGDNVWIGASATIGPGVTIGENSIVGAGAVVMRDVPANCIVVGVPARVLRYFNDDDESRGQALRAAYEEEMGPLA